MNGGYRGLTMMAALAGLALGVLAPPALAQTGASATATASATVVSESLAVTSTSDLQFGGLEVISGAGTVTLTIVDATGAAARSITGGVELQGANFHPAEILLTGTPGTPYTIQLPPAPLAENETAVRDESGDPASSLEIIVLTSLTVNTGATDETGLLDPVTGTDTVFVGGTLDVLADAKKGNYRGDITIFVTFN